MTVRIWLDHPAIIALRLTGIRTRLGISPNNASFRVGVLRTHLLAALFAHAAADHLGVHALIRVRWDDTDPARSRNEYRAGLLEEIRGVARIPVVDDGPAFRQSQRGHQYRQALQSLSEQGVVAHRGGVPCLDVAAVDRLIASHGQDPESLTYSIMVNTTAALTPTQKWVPLVRSDGRALWHLASVVDDIEQRNTLVVRGTDKANATAVHVRLHWALTGGGPPPAHVFVPRLLEEDLDAFRITALLDRKIRPSALRWFLTEQYLRPDQVPPETFTDLVLRFRPVLPTNKDSRFDLRRLSALDRKISAVVTSETAVRELRDSGAPAPQRVVDWVAACYQRPLAAQIRLCQALTRTEIEHGSPPDHVEEALRWLDGWKSGAVGVPPLPGSVGCSPGGWTVRTQAGCWRSCPGRSS